MAVLMILRMKYKTNMYQRLTKRYLYANGYGNPVCVYVWGGVYRKSVLVLACGHHHSFVQSPEVLFLQGI